ncbi:hypothetical protein [Halorussus halophilus]|uniref:hypothetical protein n=1 Tax=Halorussus halophilus TaxID=2650975 RepID=UPI0013017F1D|nr:hypothetical protein [Halorussus halophilus]
MIIEFDRVERDAPQRDSSVSLDVTGVETDRIAEYVDEWFDDVDDLHFECKGEQTFLVAGE